MTHLPFTPHILYPWTFAGIPPPTPPSVAGSGVQGRSEVKMVPRPGSQSACAWGQDADGRPSLLCDVPRLWGHPAPLTPVEAENPDYCGTWARFLQRSFQPCPCLLKKFLKTVTNSFHLVSTPIAQESHSPTHPPTPKLPTPHHRWYWGSNPRPSSCARGSALFLYCILK